MTGNADPPTRILGTLRADEGVGVVRIEARYDTDPADLWSALTEPERLARWYGSVTGELRPGGRFTVYLEGPQIDSIGRVEECRPPSFLRVRTRETDESAQNGNGEPFDQTIDVTLTGDRGYTDLVIEVGGLPLNNIAAFGVGWQLHAEGLDSHLAGRTGPDITVRWGELARPYQELAAELR